MGRITDLTGTRAYVYTFTNIGGLKEYTGIFGGEKFDGNYMFYKDVGGYLTTVPPKEGVAFHRSIWFREPNPEAARKAFSDRAMRLKYEYLMKSIRQERDILKGAY